MAEPFSLDDYKCVELPEKLWRVTHGNSQSRWDKHTGHLVASDQSRKFYNKAGLKKAVESHINWWGPKPSCFLSVFSDKDHARRWAAKCEKKHPPAYIHEIVAECLPGGPSIVLDMEMLMAKLDIKNRYSAHELLFLHRIEYWSITTSRPLSRRHDLDRSYAPRELLEPQGMKVAPRGKRIPHTDYSVDLEGNLDYINRLEPDNFYVSDGRLDHTGSSSHDDAFGLGDSYVSDESESAEERNRNDDMVKMAEGLWDYC